MDRIISISRGREAFLKAGSIRSEQSVRFSGSKVKTSVPVGFGGGKPEKSNTWGKSQDLCYGIPPSEKPPDPFDPSHDLRLPTPLFIEMIQYYKNRIILGYLKKIIPILERDLQKAKV